MSMYPHRINLRGPWQCEPLENATQRITMPCRWADTPLSYFTGRIRCQRRFHWQKPLDENERLFLVVGAADNKADVTLNGHFLGNHEGAFDPFEFEITSLMQASNDLTIETDTSGGLWGTVFLEVRRESFLQQVDINVTWKEETPQLEVNGLVLGPAGRQLDVDLLLNDALLISQPVSASIQGEPFRLQALVPGIDLWHSASFGAPKLHEFRLDLLDVHSRLFVQTERIGFRKVVVATEQVWVNGYRCVLPSPWVLDEPLLESPTLDKADIEGRLLRVALPLHGGSGSETILRLLRRHPSVIDIIPGYSS
jgi:beta-galactosidase/beta-glucuronidase